MLESFKAKLHLVRKLLQNEPGNEGCPPPILIWVNGLTRQSNKRFNYYFLWGQTLTLLSFILIYFLEFNINKLSYLESWIDQVYSLFYSNCWSVLLYLGWFLHILSPRNANIAVIFSNIFYNQKFSIALSLQSYVQNQKVAIWSTLSLPSPY